MEKGQENPPQDQALAHRVRWADLDSVFEHMGDNASVGEASSGIHLINDREHVAVRQDHEVRIPNEHLQESYVGQRDSDLRKAREMLLQAKQERPSYKPDILLGLATTFLGWFLGGFVVICQSRIFARYLDALRSTVWRSRTLCRFYLYPKRREAGQI